MGRLPFILSRCRELINAVSVSGGAFGTVRSGLVPGLFLGLINGLHGVVYTSVLVGLFLGLVTVLCVIGYIVLFKGDRRLDAVMGAELCFIGAIAVGLVFGSILTSQIAHLLSGNM